MPGRRSRFLRSGSEATCLEYLSSRQAHARVIDGDFPADGHNDQASAATVAATMAILERPCRRKIDATRRSIIAMKVKGITFRNRASSVCCWSVHAASGRFWAVCCSKATPNITPASRPVTKIASRTSTPVQAPYGSPGGSANTARVCDFQLFWTRHESHSIHRIDIPHLTSVGKNPALNYALFSQRLG
jgi:hypothetical protein